jgi:hypothetical protein
MKKPIVLLSVLTIFMSFVFTSTELSAKNSDEPEICNNGIDDNGDKNIDCNDIKCVSDPACTDGTCSNYTNKNDCNKDPYCEWLGKGWNSYCSGAISGIPSVNQDIGFLDTASNKTDKPHDSAEAQAGICTICHGDIVDNMNDGHYIPTYEPSLVTPWPSSKDQSGVNGEGNCVFCHYASVYESDDGPIPIMSNAANHHNTGFYDKSGTKCGWCHDVYSVDPDSISISAYSIRTCEGCHGMDSLHNIQADSDGDGIITPGDELPGFGHIGHNDDCFGCHGFETTLAAAITLTSSELAAISSGDRHHGLVGNLMPFDSVAPNLSVTYKCVSCHLMESKIASGSAIFVTGEDCISCHIDGPQLQ